MSEDKDREIKRIIGEAIGEASMCWEPRPTGVFLSDRASSIIDRVFDELKALTPPVD